MKIGLVGWGIETKSAYDYFGPEHSYVIGNEEPRDDFPTGNNVEIYSLSEKRAPGLVGNVSDLSYLEHYDDCELVIFQGATRKNLEKKFPEDSDFWKKAKTTLDIFFDESPTKNIIGVTGTKGKGTTTSLIYELIKGNGEQVVIGGNIGIPVLQLLTEINPRSWVALELSNFQLYKFTRSPHIAVHLMMMPEHIDEWHKTMEDYVQAKRNICSHQTANDITIYMEDNQYSKDNATYSSGTKIPYFSEPGAHIEDGWIVMDSQRIIETRDVGLIGNHNLQNICAAITATWNIHQNIAVYQSVIRDFTGLEHRLQLAGEIDGVKYYDDSFGTTPDTAIVALDAFDGPKVLIIGGHDKGNDYAGLAKRLCQDDLRFVVFIGKTGGKIMHMAVSNGFNVAHSEIRADGNSWTMKEIIDTARMHAEPGDTVLLSTGSASFGIFKDYKDRGNQFTNYVKSLAE